jgi:phage tail sheath protein FI
MPEYLAPGVYVEEIDTGSKPIEGVSTSTAGVVGVTERGPVGVPMLTTSAGEYERIFGGRLSWDDFGPHRHLPFAVEGFFANGGKRLFVVRVLDTAAATRAAFTLHARATNGIATALLRAAAEGAGSAANRLFVLDGGTMVASNTQPFRIGDGSTAEYRFVSEVRPADESTHVPLHLPLAHTHAAPVSIHHINRMVLTGYHLHADAAAGATQVVVDGASSADIVALIALSQVEVGAGLAAEYRRVVERTVDAVVNTRATVVLDAPLAIAHAVGAAVTRLDVSLAAADVFGSGLPEGARAGDLVVYAATRNDAGTIRFADPTDLVIIGTGTAQAEVRRIGALHALMLGRAMFEVVPAASVVQGVTMVDTGAARALSRDAALGSLAVTLDNRNGLAVGNVLRIGAGDAATYVRVVALPNRALGGDDPGTVILAHPLRVAYARGTAAAGQTVTETAGRPVTATLFESAPDAARIMVGDGTAYVAGDAVRIVTPAGADRYAVLAENADPLDPRLVAVSVPVARAHPAGSAVVQRNALLLVEALDAGGWGNRVRVSVEDEELGLLARTSLETVVSARQLRLGTYGGVEPGTVLEVLDPGTGARVGDLLKVVDVNRVSGTITLDADLTAAHLNAIAALPPGARLLARSREFRLTVRLYRAPEPAVPTRSETVIDSEGYRYLSMDPRHSRYVETVIGAVDGPPRRSDGRPAGASLYVRVDDAAGNDQAVLFGVRLGPETLLDVLPSGRTQPARHQLGGGNDSVGTITDETYVGVDAVEPEARTGLHSLRNVDDLSIVAAPGRLSVRVQGALIEHCELMRYRFAVLDGPRPPADSLNDVQDQRQQFDTRYAALYHPWPLIREPFPIRLDDAPLLAIPPSGHIIGVYARTDVERGVHKAPANEVVRGVESLSRLLNKAEQDLLNPSPKNINVIRDFRADNRGIRVWGARVITSDPDYKYVNVRRLLIFIERSVERGLQWVVFEPNAEALWARVRQSITSFLTVVWRNGALEGVKIEQAFFVKCDRTTMTQTDIDSGRLIVLVGVAPVKPAEFVIVRIGLKTAVAES